MKPSASAVKRPNALKKKPANDFRLCSSFHICSTLLIGWIFVLGYYWESGQLHLSNLPTQTSVDGDIKNTKVSLQGSTSNSLSVVSSDNPEASDIHVVFSTDCGEFQDWQTLLLFHSAMIVGQGPTTRIASGCDDAKKANLTALYKKLHPNYHVHFTPDFSRDEKSKRRYSYYNKPRGVQHWLKYADPKVPNHVAVAVIDPDMIFVRPLTTEIRGLANKLHNKKVKNKDLMERISLGRPVAQMYGLGCPWCNDTHIRFNRLRICGEGSPCLIPDIMYGQEHYSVGPPYIVIKEDMIRLTDTWTRLVPRVFAEYPYLLAEMYAYSMAAAHEKLPHFQLENYMVSNAESGGEGWSFIEKFDDVCIPPENGIYYPGLPLPNLVHYCQHMESGGLSFGKRQVPYGVFSCDFPLFKLPPEGMGVIPIGSDDLSRREYNKILYKKRKAFELCVIHRSFNSALLHYKKTMCGTSTANLDATYMATAVL